MQNEPIISKIKLPNNEVVYNICDKTAIHSEDAITKAEIDEICGALINNEEE